MDLIATYGTPATYAAKEATATIPIVMIGVGDPVRAGLVASLARPGGNITGNTVLSPDLGPKRLQILREVSANVRRVVYLANPDNASNIAALAETKIAASAAGTVLIPVEVRVVGDFDPAFAVIMRERPDAILVSNDPFHQLHIGRIIEFLAKNRLPAMFQSKESVAAGGFIGYGPSLPDLFQRAAGYVHRILQGTNPADYREIDAAFASFVRERPDAVFVGSGPFLLDRRVQLARLAAYHSVPATYQDRLSAEAGGLMSYGASLADAYHQVGACAGILKGAKPGDVPVVQSSKFELVISASTARMLGLTMPDKLLVAVDEVIE